MNEDLARKIDGLCESIEQLKQEVAHIRREMPILHWTSTQQLEILDALLQRLGVDRGYLPPTRGWAASPDILLVIAGHLLERRPQVFVECGSGVSTIVAARCLEMNGGGKVYSLEHYEQEAERTSKAVEARGLASRVSVLPAPLKTFHYHGVETQWYDVAALPDLAIEYLFVDGPPVTVDNPYARYAAGPELFPRLAAGALVVCDDVLRETEQRVLNTWRQDFPGVVIRFENTEKGCAVLHFAEPPTSAG